MQASTIRPGSPSDAALAAIRQQFKDHGLTGHQLQALASTAPVPPPAELAWGLSQFTGNTLSVEAQRFLARFDLKAEGTIEDEPSDRVTITRLQADNFITISLLDDPALRDAFKPWGGWAGPNQSKRPAQQQQEEEQEEEQDDLGPQAEIEADALEVSPSALLSEGDYLEDPEERNDDDNDDEPSDVAARQPVTPQPQPLKREPVKAETPSVEEGQVQQSSVEQGRKEQPAPVTPSVAATDGKQLNRKGIMPWHFYETMPTLQDAIQVEANLSDKGLRICLRLAYLIDKGGEPVSISHGYLAIQCRTKRRTVIRELDKAKTLGLFKVVNGRKGRPLTYDFGHWIESGACLVAEEAMRKEMNEKMRQLSDAKQSAQDAYAERSKAICD
jgi:hypothetical protein